MSSETAPRFETKVEFVERIIESLLAKGYPDRVVSRIVIPLMTGEVSANPFKAKQLMRQICETKQDEHSFRVHFIGGD